MKDKKTIQYSVEREFLAKFSAKELIVRIIKSHLQQSDR